MYIFLCLFACLVTKIMSVKEKESLFGVRKREKKASNIELHNTAAKENFPTSKHNSSVPGCAV